MKTYPLITRDPASGQEMIVTRLECPESGTVLEGRFALGWIGRLSPEQLEFVGALARNRGNVQKLAAELGVAYNTARARLDEVVAALGGPPDTSAEEPPAPARPAAVRALDALDALEAGDIDFDEAMRRLRGRP